MPCATSEISFLPDAGDERVADATIFLEFFSEARQQNLLVRGDLTSRDEPADDHRQYGDDRRTVLERPGEQHQQHARIDRMADVSVEPGLDQDHSLAASAIRRKEMKLYAGAQRQPQSGQFEQ